MTTTLASDRPSATAGALDSQFACRERELPQHMQALAEANRIRTATAQHKRDVKASAMPLVMLANLIEEQPEGITHARLDVMLRAVPRMGRVRTERMASRWGLTRGMLGRQIGPIHDPDRKKLQLTERQRHLVVRMLRFEGERLAK